MRICSQWIPIFVVAAAACLLARGGDALVADAGNSESPTSTTLVPAAAADDDAAAAARHFDQHIAPLLARDCLESHSSSAKKGKLDLSRKVKAFAGGKSKRKAIVPGKSAESLMWELVESDEMPADDRPRLAGWPGEDPDAVGEHGGPQLHARPDRRSVRRPAAHQRQRPIHDGTDARREGRGARRVQHDARRHGRSTTAGARQARDEAGRWYSRLTFSHGANGRAASEYPHARRVKGLKRPV